MKEIIKKTILCACVVLQLGCSSEEEETPFACSNFRDQSISTDEPVQTKNVTLLTLRQRVERRDCDNNVISNKIEVVSDPTQPINIVPQEISKEERVGLKVAANRTSCDTVFDRIDFMKGLSVDAGPMGFSEKRRRILRNQFLGFVVEYGTEPKREVGGFAALGEVLGRVVTLGFELLGPISRTRVLPGLNFIDYQLLSPCAELDEEGKDICPVENRRLLEKGVMILEVEHREELKPGLLIKEICEEETPVE